MQREKCLRCMNCQEALILDSSLTERYPEWRALKFGEKKPQKQTPAVEEASDDPDSSVASGFSQMSSPADVGDGGNLGHVTTMTGNLFDIICDDATPIDHPMCAECTDKLLDCMDGQLKALEEECADYQKLMASLQLRHSNADLNALRLERAKLQSEESALRAELAKLEEEEEEIDRQLDVERSELETVAKEEERLWRVYRDHTRQLVELAQEERSVDNQLAYSKEQLGKLCRANIFNLTFHIWHEGRFGTINRFRLGTLPDQPVDWSEINAAWGQILLLLNCLARAIDFQFSRFELVPYGSYSYIRVSGEAKDKELPLYYSGYKFRGSKENDAAMVGILECLNELKEELNRRHVLYLPHVMSKDKILDNDKEYSVKIQFNSEERWTKAMKCLLVNLKWALTGVASLK